MRRPTKNKRPPKDIASHLGYDTKIYKLDTAKNETIGLVTSPTCALVLTWEEDHTGYGFWRIKLIGVKEEGIITKEFTPGVRHAAFYGSMSAIGAGQTELYASFSYEDDDIKDEDEHVINKIKEVRIYPVEE